MRTSRSEYYLRKDFGFIDLGVPAAIGHTTVAVYEVLRRYVWRSTKVGNGISRKAYGDGRLVAKVSQSTVAELLGLTRKTIGKYVSLLRDVGWIQTEGKEDDMIYILGERVEVEAGGAVCERELFYSDAICIHVAEDVQEIAEKEGLQKATELPVQRRVALVKELLGRNKGKPLEVLLGDESGGPENIFPNPGNFFPAEEGGQGKKFAEKEDNPTGYGKEGEEGTRDLGRSLRSSPENAPPGRVTQPRPPVREEHSRSTCAETCNPDDEPSEEDHVVRRIVVSEAIEKARAKSKAQREENLRKDREKERLKAQRASKKSANDSEMGPLLKDAEEVWRRAYAEKFEGVPLAEWSGKEIGQVKQLIKKYTGAQAYQGLRYLVLNWDAIKERFKRVRGYPTVGFLLKFHDALIPEAVRFAEVFEVKERWDAWWEENSGKGKELPADLERDFEAHRKELESLGLI